MKPAPVAVNTAASKSSVSTSKPSWLGRLLRVFLLLLLLLIAAAMALPYALPWLLQKQGIDFHWQNPQWQYHGFSASHIRLNLSSDPAQRHYLHIDKLRVDWAWQALPIRGLRIARLEAAWPIAGHENTAAQPSLALSADLLKWLPQYIDLQDIDAKLIGLGHLQGTLKLQANAQGKLWQPSFIDSQLTLKDLDSSWLDSIPAELQPTQLSAQITTHPDHQDTADGQQLLTLDLHSQGPARLQLNGLLHLQQTPVWQGRLSNAQLYLELDALQQPSFSTQQLRAQLYFSGHADSERFSVKTEQHSNLSTEKIRLTEIGTAEQISLQLAGLSLQGQSLAPYNIEVDSPLTAQIKQLNIEQLHPQDWDFKGSLSGQLPRLNLSGNLSGQQGLSLDSRIDVLDNAIQGRATLKEIFFKAGNPLEKTFKDWPELVLFSSGRLHSQIDFTLPAQKPLNLSINGSASGLNGIVNRSTLKNLDLEFNGQLSGQSFKLGIANLTIEQLDPGIPIGPIELQDAHYQANLDNPLQGVANWQSLQAHLLKGKVWLDAQQFDLKRPQTLPLQVRGLELQEFLKVYPAEGLAGTGTIDGLLPIHIENGEFYIEAGQLQARQPGVLQFQSDKIHALGQSNPAMRLVADALEDFHFNLLSSALSYDQSGKLLLNVRLEGRNPDVEKGRPIHLNVNLEEDIPALLASIQLSGQVSEIIQKRVRERLEKR